MITLNGKEKKIRDCGDGNKASYNLHEGILQIRMVSSMTISSGSCMYCDELTQLKAKIINETEKKVKESIKFWDRYLLDVNFNSNGISSGKKTKFKIECFLKPIDECNDETAREVVAWFEPLIADFRRTYDVGF